jgi:hypothetical protein
MVMVHMRNAPGGFTAWEPLIRRRFQPTIHTRIGAICLFSAGTLLTERGFAVLSHNKLLANVHAKTPLPSWIGTTLVVADAKYREIATNNVR